MSVRAIEFYCGIGGLHRAFARSTIDGTVVQAFDWDQTACKVYAANHQPGVVQKVDISTLDASRLASLDADVWLLSPACQPYTVLNPNAKGASDPRAQSFLHLVQNVLPSMADMDALPRRLLVENVAGFETSTTREITLSTLKSLGYSTLELLLTPLQFGIPNSRLRYYLLAKKASLRFCSTSPGNSDTVWRHIPGQSEVWTDPRLRNEQLLDDVEDSAVQEIRSYLNENALETYRMHSVPNKVLEKWGRLFDIVLPSSRRSCCFTRGYTQLVERAGSILQTNEQLDTTETFKQFLSAQSVNEPDAIQILHPLALRYFTPDELLRIFDFNPICSPGDSADFKWPDGITNKTKYRMIGNSVNVRVVKELINYLFQDG